MHCPDAPRFVKSFGIVKLMMLSFANVIGLSLYEVALLLEGGGYLGGK